MVSLTAGRWKIVAGMGVALCLVMALLALRSDDPARDVVGEKAAASESACMHTGSVSCAEVFCRNGTGDADAIIAAPPQEIQAKGEMARLASICSSLILAYSNRQDSAVAEWVDRLPPMVSQLSYEQREETILPLERVVLLDFYTAPGNAGTVAFSDAQSLSKHLNTLFYGMRLIGDILTSRDPSSPQPVVMEGRMFSILNSYKTKYSNEGEKDFEKAVDEVLSKWVVFAESDGGYTKSSVARDIASFRRGGYRIRDEVMKDMSWNDYIESRIEQCASYLVKCGYRPKWIDEMKIAETQNAPPPDWITPKDHK